MSANDSKVILDGGVVVCSDGAGHWYLEGGGKVYVLSEVSDFWRVISLLESPIDSVRLALGPDFPYLNVISAGIKNDSDYWVGLALSWVDKCLVEDISTLRGDLENILLDKKNSQKNQQAAHRLLRRLKSKREGL